MTTRPLHNIAFLGLGTMGYPMAGHLARHGFTVTVYNRTTTVADRWLSEYTGAKADTPEAAVASAGLVFTCVGKDSDVRDMYRSIFLSAKPGTLLVDHTTTSPSLARTLGIEARNKGLQFMDAPLSGGQVGAEQGQLTIMAGADQATFDTVSPVMDSYAKAITHVGDIGQGQVLKMINQVCIAGTLQGLSEAWMLAKASNIQAEVLVDALQHGAAGSWQMVNRSATAMDNSFDFGFAVDWMRKDLAICLQEAKKLGVALPLVQQVDQHYKNLQDRGYARADTSVLIKQFDQENTD